jgi:hypothetical protein
MFFSLYRVVLTELCKSMGRFAQVWLCSVVPFNFDLFPSSGNCMQSAGTDL